MEFHTLHFGIFYRITRNKYSKSIYKNSFLNFIEIYIIEAGTNVTDNSNLIPGN